MFNVLNINNLRFWYCLGFRASDLEFSLGGSLGLPARRAYSPEGAKKIVEVILLNILPVRINSLISDRKG